MSDFAGTGSLIGLALRRDRWLLPAWIIGFAAMAGGSAGATVGLYPDESQRVAAAEAVNSTSALVALYGPLYDPTSIGELSLFKLTAFGAALTAVLMIFVVIRHTRADEEAGRLELMAAGRMGRAAPLAAALIVACAASLLLGVASALALVAVGLAVAGSFAFGLGWAFTGIAFGGVAGICAQVTTGARTARGLALIAVALAYAVRAVADISAGTWLSWLSPIGWMQQVRAYAGDRWWVLLLPLALAAVCIPVAFALRNRRDMGAGLISDRPGPATGELGTVFDLAWRMQRGVLLVWCLGFAAFGLLLGSISDSVSGFLDSPQAAKFLEQLGGTQGLADAFLATELSIAGVIVAGYGISAASRLHSEEVDGHAELLLSTPTSRARWAASHTIIALLGVAVVLLIGGVGIAVGNALALGDTSRIGSLLVASLARVPAAWVLTGVVVILFGWLPRWVPLAWGVFVLAFAIGEFGPLWKAPQWLMDVSPFVHSPRFPAVDTTVTGLLPLTLVAVLLIAAGFLGWQRRDLHS
jgi:ABC-2 type transport system permease protein